MNRLSDTLELWLFAAVVMGAMVLGELAFGTLGAALPLIPAGALYFGMQSGRGFGVLWGITAALVVDMALARDLPWTAAGAAAACLALGVPGRRGDPFRGAATAGALAGVLYALVPLLATTGRPPGTGWQAVLEWTFPPVVSGLFLLAAFPLLARLLDRITRALGLPPVNRPGGSQR